MDKRFGRKEVPLGVVINCELEFGNIFVQNHELIRAQFFSVDIYALF